MKNVLRNIITGWDEKIMPFVFSESYELFTKNVLKNSYLLFFSEKANAIMPVRKFSIKSFSFIQPLNCPISLSGEKLSTDIEKQFLNEFTALVAAKKIAIRILQSYSHAIFQSFPDSSIYCPFGTYIINLQSFPEGKLFSNLHPKHRNVIRNADRLGLTIKYGKEVLPDFYSLYSQTMERGHMYCESYGYFEKMYDILGKEKVICGVVYHQARPQASLFMPYTYYSSYYLYGASAGVVEITGAANFLHWKTIALLKNQGVKQYDFAGARLSNIEGTKLEGIQNFKKRFGGDLMEGYLWKKDIDTIRCKLFDTLIQVKHIINGKELYKDIIDEELEKKINDAKQ